MRGLWEKLVTGYRARKAGIPDFVAKKSISIRAMRRARFLPLLAEPASPFNEDYFKAIVAEKKEQDRILWKVMVSYLTLIVFLGFSIAPIKLQFSLFGFSSADLYALREVVLFLCAIISSYLFLVQSFIYQLEDVLDVMRDTKAGSETARRFFSLSYLSPINALQIAYYPPPDNHFPTKFSVIVLRLFDISRVAIVLMFSLAMMSIPCLVAYSILVHPTHGLWISIIVVLTWTASAVLSLAHTFISTRGIRFADFTYVMKLQAVADRDPARHAQIHAEIARTNALLPLE